MIDNSVYQALAEHQLTEAWSFQEVVKEARSWMEKLAARFKLDIGPVALCVDRLTRNTLGYYRSKHNGFGLRGEIALNSLHLQVVSEGGDTGAPAEGPGNVRFKLDWDAIGTLFHEMLHAHQDRAHLDHQGAASSHNDHQGKANSHNHHNKEFRDLALEFGLIVDRHGVTTYVPDGKFIALLKEHGVAVPKVLEPQPTHRGKVTGRGKSKLKKWICGCHPPVNLRVGKAEVRIRCLDCGTVFVKEGEALAAPAGEGSAQSIAPGLAAPDAMAATPGVRPTDELIDAAAPAAQKDPEPAASGLLQNTRAVQPLGKDRRSEELLNLPVIRVEIPRPQAVALIDNKSILTSTSGFLKSGFTHTINLAQGCSFAGSLCGTYCYAQHNHWITMGRPWGLYGYKKNVVEAYRREYDRIKRPRSGSPGPLRIFKSSSTDPYAPQEARLGYTAALLREMLRRPPDTLVIQTRSPLVARDRDLIRALADLCEVWVSITVETDMDRVPGFPNHATPPRKRIATLKVFRDAGVQTQATVSPLLPLESPGAFAGALEEACDRVILDHYLFGDGSQGLRTKRTSFPAMLEAAGFGSWNSLDKFWEVKGVFDDVFGPRRVLVSDAGFNAVGPNRP